MNLVHLLREILPDNKQWGEWWCHVLNEEKKEDRRTEDSKSGDSLGYVKLKLPTTHLREEMGRHTLYKSGELRGQIRLELEIWEPLARIEDFQNQDC